MENCPIQINKVKDGTFTFQEKAKQNKHKQTNKYTCLKMTKNPRNNRQNDRSKFLEKLKQAIPSKRDNHLV